MTYKSEREEDEINYALSKKKKIAKSHRSNVKISQIFVLDKVSFFWKRLFLPFLALNLKTDTVSIPCS